MTAPAGQEVPVFSECVIGYRAWESDDEDQLWPIADDRRPWVPGVNTARCNCGSWNSLRFEWSWYQGRRILEPAPEHPAPQTDCDCGLYSWRRPPRDWWEDPEWGEPPDPIGAVASWGALQVHQDGFRAEHACVVTLAHPIGASPETIAELQRIARRYRVECVPLDLLEQAASRHGTPLPDSLQPPPDSPEPGEDIGARWRVRAPAPDATPEEVVIPRPPRGLVPKKGFIDPAGR